MKKSIPLLLLSSFVLTACGPNKIVADLPSPSGKYHVEVRKCPQRGSLTWGEQTQVSVLAAGVSEKCNAFISALTQFQANSPEDQLRLEWVSDTELKASHPALAAGSAPMSVSQMPNNPVKIIFSVGK